MTRPTPGWDRHNYTARAYTHTDAPVYGRGPHYTKSGGLLQMHDAVGVAEQETAAQATVRSLPWVSPRMPLRPVRRPPCRLRRSCAAARDPGYDEARVLFNAMVDRRPAVIAQCASPDDVARASDWPGRRGSTSPCGGGHGVAGTALAEGLVVDLRRMRGHRRPRARTAGSGWRHDEPSRPGRPAPRPGNHWRGSPPRGRRLPPWAAGPGGSTARSAWPATTSCRSSSSPRRARSSSPATPRTPTCSGAAAGAATSASRPR